MAIPPRPSSDPAPAPARRAELPRAARMLVPRWVLRMAEADQRLPVRRGQRLPARRPTRAVQRWQAPKNTTRNNLIAFIVVLVLFFGVGGTLVAIFIARGMAGEVPRTPANAVDAFMHVAFVERNEQAAAGRLCAAPAVRDAVNQVIVDLEAREARTGAKITFTWGDLREETKVGNRVVVAGEVIEEATVNEQRVRADPQTWRFTVVKEGSWKICGLERSSG